MVAMSLALILSSASLVRGSQTILSQSSILSGYRSCFSVEVTDTSR